MAWLARLPFGLNSTTSGVELDAVASGSTVTIVTSPVRTGTYACRSKPTGATAANARFNLSSSNLQGVFYVKADFYVAAVGTNARTLLYLADSSNASKLGILLNTNLTLNFRNIEDSANIGSASAAVALNTWNTAEFKIDNTTLSACKVEARLNGAWFSTGTIDLSSGIARLQFGCNVADTTYDVTFDNVGANNNTGSFQNSWLGNSRFLMLRPNATGDSNGFSVQVGGTAGSANNFTRVNEVTPDDATSYNGSAIISSEDLFACESSGLPSNAIINAIGVGVRFADLVGADATAAFKVEIEKTSGGTKAQSATLIPNSTTWRTNAPASPWIYPLITYQDPDGANWTTSTVDSSQIGYIQTAVNVQTIAVSTLWKVVDYTLPTASGNFAPFL